MPITEKFRRRLADTRTVAIYGGALLLMLLIPLFVIIHGKAQRTYPIDFAALYFSGFQLFAGKDVYAGMPFEFLGSVPVDGQAIQQNPHPNLNPPTAVLILSPLSRLPFAYAYWSWSLISLACAVATAWLLAGGYAASERRFAWSVGLLILLLAYSPTWLAISLGQTTLFLLLLLVAGWRTARAARERSAGAILGATLALKPFVGVLLVYFVLRRQWRHVAWCVGSFAAANLIVLAVMGPGIFAGYLKVLRQVDWHGMNMNASIFGFLARLSAGADGQPFVNAGDRVELLGYGISVLLLCSLFPLKRRLAVWPARQAIDLGYAYCLVLMLLISPLGWIYYFPLLLPCTLVILCSEAGTPAERRLFRLGAGTAWLVGGIMCFLFVGKVLPAAPGSTFAIGDVYMGILVAIAAMLFYMTGVGHRQRDATTETRETKF